MHLPANTIVGLTNEYDVARLTEMVLEAIEQNGPIGTEGAMTVIGLVNPFLRPLIQRHVNKRLRPGGTHHHLVTGKRWLRGREKWAAQLAEKCGTVTEYRPQTSDTVVLSKTLEEMSGSLSAYAQDAVATGIATLEAHANRKLTDAGVQHLTETFHALLREAAVNQAKLGEQAKADAKVEAAFKRMDLLIHLLAKQSGVDPAVLSDMTDDR